MLQTKQHYNELQLEIELEKYLTQHLENYQWRFDNEARSYKYSENWLPENIERVEKDLELLHMKIGFYKTQLENLLNNTK
jgi:hypothetical protein